MCCVLSCRVDWGVAFLKCEIVVFRPGEKGEFGIGFADYVVTYVFLRACRV